MFIAHPDTIIMKSPIILLTFIDIENIGDSDDLIQTRPVFRVTFKALKTHKHMLTLLI